MHTHTHRHDVYTDMHTDAGRAHTHVHSYTRMMCTLIHMHDVYTDMHIHSHMHMCTDMTRAHSYIKA